MAMMTTTEYEQVQRLTELGGFATTSDAVRAAVEEVLSRLEAEEAQQPTAKAKP